MGRLTERKPKLAAAVVIKMGIYMLRFMDAPDYAVLNTQVELIKRLGKKRAFRICKRCPEAVSRRNSSNFRKDARI